MNQFQDTIVSAADASVLQNTQAIYLANIMGFSYQATFTGVPNGTVKLQMSNDAGSVTSAAAHTGTGVTNWTDITLATFSVSGAGNFGFDYSLPGFRWVRLVYTPTSGTGAMTVTFSAKGG